MIWFLSFKSAETVLPDNLRPPSQARTSPQSHSQRLEVVLLTCSLLKPLALLLGFCVTLSLFLSSWWVFLCQGYQVHCPVTQRLLILHPIPCPV